MPSPTTPSRTFPPPPLPSRRRPALALLVACVVAVGIAGACGDEPPPRPATTARFPHAMDRLARLMRAEFASPDPVAVEQEIRCESARLQRVLGADFRVRERLLLDSLHQEFAAEQFNQLSQRLATSGTPSGDAPACRSINEAAEREVPLR